MPPPLIAMCAQGLIFDALHNHSRSRELTIFAIWRAE